MNWAHALKCHQCKDFYDCSGPAICPPFSTHCLTTSSISMGRNLISKMCHTDCPNTKAAGFGDFASVDCCQADLCNHGGVAHKEVNYVSLVLGLSFSLICILLLRTGL
ncbi:secreted Ly-6/uPAR domain-containing protein 2-like [Tachyglossus aculeatus]|uniref:secreted Ly-6/uPAR domain-containing protein 2-like n=1 Tax=Tachyglossus aculeatus TaxID=9261 RepID=UPI0018F793D4|nr:secreted Ly-6/uPAR domain-containing protein 2-like [Tachyglossus aculeatus]